MSRCVPVLTLVACGMLAGDAPAADVDWSRYADTGTLEVVTRDEDGAARETTIWIAVLDGAAYIRTGSTTWGDNAERNPEVALRFEGGDETPVRVEVVGDEALRQRVEAAFHEKYGWTDTFVGWFRMGDTRIMRLAPR